MAKVEMRAWVSGTRDGVDWPAPGEIADISDDEAAALIASGLAVEVAAVDTEPKPKRGRGKPETAAVDTEPAK